MSRELVNNNEKKIYAIVADQSPTLEQSNIRINFLNRATLDDAFIMKFSESTPLRLIKRIKPDILIKGGDYKANQIVGNEFVKKNNGEVKIIPFLKGYSTSNLIKKIKKSIE